MVANSVAPSAGMLSGLKFFFHTGYCGNEKRRYICPRKQTTTAMNTKLHQMLNDVCARNNAHLVEIDGNAKSTYVTFSVKGVEYIVRMSDHKACTARSKNNYLEFINADTGHDDDDLLNTYHEVLAANGIEFEYEEGFGHHIKSCNGWEQVMAAQVETAILW